MTHPLEDLAAYVDGSLDAAERADVETHLGSCARCRDEVRRAGAAREAVRAMPAPEPIDLTGAFAPERLPALRRSRTEDHPSRAAGRGTWGRLAPALAAAAVVALVALVVPRLGSSSNDASTSADSAGAPEAALPAPGRLRLQLDPTDYDQAALEAAARTAGGATALTEDGESAAAVPAAADLRPAGRSATDRAVACLGEAFPDFPGRLVEVRRATFEGTPAYLGFVREGRSDDPERISVWVAAASDCSIVTLTSVDR